VGEGPGGRASFDDFETATADCIAITRERRHLLLQSIMAFMVALVAPCPVSGLCFIQRLTDGTASRRDAGLGTCESHQRTEAVK
jgi:hypothetical protein